MILNREFGSYARGSVVRMFGGFKFTAAGTLVDTIRDGHSACVASVTRISAGLYELTLDTGFPIPELPVTQRAWVDETATPTKVMAAHIVTGSWNQSTRKFRVCTVQVGSTASGTYIQPAVADPDDQARIEFEIVGSIVSVGTDLA